MFCCRLANALSSDVLNLPGSSPDIEPESSMIASMFDAGVQPGVVAAWLAAGASGERDYRRQDRERPAPGDESLSIHLYPFGQEAPTTAPLAPTLPCC